MLMDFVRNSGGSFAFLSVIKLCISRQALIYDLLDDVFLSSTH